MESSLSKRGPERAIPCGLFSACKGEEQALRCSGSNITGGTLSKPLISQRNQQGPPSQMVIDHKKQIHWQVLRGSRVHAQVTCMFVLIRKTYFDYGS